MTAAIKLGDRVRHQDFDDVGIVIKVFGGGVFASAVFPGGGGRYGEPVENFEIVEPEPDTKPQDVDRDNFDAEDEFEDEDDLD